jgi:hypothetical protein
VATHADSARCPRSHSGDYVSTEVDWLLEQLVSRFSPALQLHPQAVVLDAHLPGSTGIRALKSILLDLRNQTMQVNKSYCHVHARNIASYHSFSPHKVYIILIL